MPVLADHTETGHSDRAQVGKPPLPDSARPRPRAASTRGPSLKSAESLTREDWIDAAWEALGEGSVDRVRVEPLAKDLGVTKGSFYWHFKDRLALVDALLDRWFAIWEEDRGAEEGAAADPGERLWALFERVIRRVTRGQTVSLRLWSHHNPAIAERIGVEDDKRLRYFREQFEALGFTPGEARVRGQVYQALISGEYLRSGGQPLAERLKRARQHHDMLTDRRP